MTLWCGKRGGDISRSSKLLLGSKSAQSLNAFAVHTNPLSGVASPGAAWADQVHRHGAKIGSGGQFSFKYSNPPLEGAASPMPIRSSANGWISNQVASPAATDRAPGDSTRVSPRASSLTRRSALQSASSTTNATGHVRCAHSDTHTARPLHTHGREPAAGPAVRDSTCERGDPRAKDGGCAPPGHGASRHGSDDEAPGMKTPEKPSPRAFRSRKFAVSSDGGLMIHPARKLELSAPDKPLTAPTPLAGQTRLLTSMASVPAGFSPSNNLLLGSRDRAWQSSPFSQAKRASSLKSTSLVFGETRPFGVSGEGKRVLSFHHRALSGQAPTVSTFPRQATTLVPSRSAPMLDTPHGQEIVHGKDQGCAVVEQAEEPVLSEDRPSQEVITASNRALLSAWEADLARTIQAGRRSEATKMSAPQAGGSLLRCYIQRVKTDVLGPTCYKLFLESGDVFLLASRKRFKCQAAQYLISESGDSIRRHKQESVAKLKLGPSCWSYTLSSRSTSSPPQGFSKEEVAVSFRHDNALLPYTLLREVFVAMPIPAPRAPRQEKTARRRPTMP
ncbi:MAG: hypothetical protein WDW38_005444 [Sanguina aurantia]